MHSEPVKQVELFTKTGNGWKLWTIFGKSFIVNVWRDSGYVYEISILVANIGITETAKTLPWD